jgi:hypothetical protein
VSRFCANNVEAVKEDTVSDSTLREETEREETLSTLTCMELTPSDDAPIKVVWIDEPVSVE